MAESILSRFWNAVRPPPAVHRAGDEKKKLTPKQTLLLRIGIGVGALALIGVGVYFYIMGAQERADTRFQEGIKVMRPGSYGDSIKMFTQSIGMWARADAYLERGIAHHYLGEDDPALEDFNQAIDLNPDLARAYSARGSIFRSRGDFKHALDEFSRSIGIESNVDALFERGQTYESLGEHQKAIDDYDKAVLQISDAPYVYRARSLAKRNLGDTAGYEADRDKAKSLESFH
jgi:tetratricopeptide (TPR) repeat protein